MPKLCCPDNFAKLEKKQKPQLIGAKSKGEKKENLVPRPEGSVGTLA